MRTNWMWLAVMGGLAACGPAGDDAAYRDALSKGGDFEVPEDRTDVSTSNPEEEEGEDGERYICVDREYSVERAPLEYATFDPNTDIIYPGSLLQGKTLANPTPDPIAVRRAGGTVSIDLLNGSSGVSVDVDEVGYGSIQTALNQIIGENNGQGAARFTLESSEVQSREQLAFALGVNVSTLTTDASAALSFSSDTELNRWVVKLTQSYFTMTYDMPTSMEEVFASDVSPEEIERYVQPGNPAAYVASVTYGRIFYLLVETTASRTELEASVNASYQAAVVGGSLDAEATYVNDLAEAKVKVFALGGDPGLALATFGGSFDAVSDFLTQGGDITTGRPLSYKLRSVNTNETVYVKVATDYAVRECIPVDLSMPSPIAYYDGTQQVSWESGEGFPDAVSSWGDAWGDPAMTAYPVDGKNYGGRYLGANVDAGGDYVAMSGGFSTMARGMSFPGQTLRNTDYTLFAVVRAYLNPDFDEEAWFLAGNNPAENQGITMGFVDNDTVFVSHGGDQILTADLDIDIQAAFHLFTVRFSQTDGLRLYVNGQLRAEDTTITTPLLGFSGAQMGCMQAGPGVCDVDAIHFRDLTLVGEALSEVDRDNAETVRLVNYGL